jgi:hypothetical protein
MLLVAALASAFQTVLVNPAQGVVSPGADPSHLVLAAPEGQYTLLVGHNCAAIVPGANVEFWHLSDVADQLVLAPLDDSGRAQTSVSSDGVTLQSMLCSVAIDTFEEAPSN